MIEKIEKLNNKLNKIKLRIKGNKIYLRGTFPAKPNDGLLPKQYELSTKLNADDYGIKIAFARAQDMESKLILDKFKWDDYIEAGEMGEKPISKWIEEFETNYWLTHDFTPNRYITLKNNYLQYFKHLPLDKQLNQKIIEPLLAESLPSSAKRKTSLIAYKALLNFAKINHNLDKFKSSYKPKIKREIPTDKEIEDIVESIPKEMQWSFAMLATYGLRIHELAKIDINKIKQEPHVIYVAEETKTKSRAVYPVPPQWVNKWSLWNKHLPENVKEKDLPNCFFGNYMACRFRYMAYRYSNRQKFSQYFFRDAYAIRCNLYGIDSSIASKWMGHSLTVHFNSYLKYFDEIHHQKTWDKMKEQYFKKNEAE
jgi:integrase